MMFLPLLAAGASALSNTSPFIAIAEQTRFDVPNNHRSTQSGSVVTALQNVVAPAVERCAYDAYVFVEQPEVSERDINDDKMPFLSHAINKSVSRYLMALAMDGGSAEVASYAGKLESALQSECKAVPITADSAASVPFEAFTDTKPRIVRLSLPRGTSTNEADEAIKRVVGHLPSGNFLLTYRTTPKSVDVEESEAQQTAQPKAYQSLFENYQFFNSAIFMGLMATGLVVTVFMVGLQAVASMQISYAAFEPEKTKSK